MASKKVNAGRTKTPLKDTDTEPDKLLGHDVDTDTPVDRQVTNDSVLRGEDHADAKLDNMPAAGTGKSNKRALPEKKKVRK